MQQGVFSVGDLLTEYSSLALMIEGQASGGQGIVVWGPNAKKGGKWQAVKMVLPRLADPTARAAFEQEALVWCHLWAHPCIILAYSLLHIPGLNDLPVIELEYAPGGSLRDQLSQAHQTSTPISLESAFKWAQMIAAGLEYIHTPDPDHDRPVPLIHCDLKPENVLLDKDNWAKLTDLGMAKAYANGGVVPISPLGTSDTGEINFTTPINTSQFTRSMLLRTGGKLPKIGTQGNVQGTPQYMPPEQWRGVDAVVPASDIYAFGILLFELFAGVDAFPHVPLTNTILGWYEAHFSGPTLHLTDPDMHALDLGPLSEKMMNKGVAQVAEQIDALIQECLSPHPRQRPTATILRERLADLGMQVGLNPIDIHERAAHTPANEIAFWGNLSITYGNIGQIEERLRLAGKVKDIDPSNPNCWVNLGVAYREAMLHNEALEAYNEAEQRLTSEWLKEYPNLDANIYYSRGKVFFDLEQYPEAVAAFRQAVQIDLEYGSAWGNLAISLFNLGVTTPAKRTQLLQEAQSANAIALRLMPEAQLSQQLEAQILRALSTSE